MLFRRTKFLVPRFAGTRLNRPELARSVLDAAERGVALIMAPAGYGKTTLMTEVADAFAGPTLWIQLDRADNDPSGFVTCLAEGLERALPQAAPQLRTLLRGARDQPAERLLTLLVNELLDGPSPAWLLALDDYHQITNPDVHRLATSLLDNPPPEMRAVIATRSVPPLPLHRWRARGRLFELGSERLRFSLEETGAWLAAERSLPDDVVAALHHRTEGWGAGLRLVANLLADGDDASGWLDSIDGTHPHVFGYLTNEVFERQSDEVREFLLGSAVLPHMTGELCRALLGRDDAEAMLTRLEREHAFVVRFRDQGTAFRYHPLFRETLLERLAAEAPARLRHLRDRAARLYEAGDEPELALGSYLDSGDAGNALRLLESFGARILADGRFTLLRGYLQQLEGRLGDRPALLLLYGLTLHRTGDLGAARGWLERARAAARERQDDDTACAAITELAAIARSQGDYLGARRYAAEALEQGANAHAQSRALALMELAKNEGLLSGTDRGRELAEQAADAMSEAGAALDPVRQAQLLRSLAQICWWQGDVDAALAACLRALERMPARPSPLEAEVLLTMALPRLYRHEYEEALRNAERALSLCQRFELRELLPSAHTVLGNVLTRLGQPDRAETALRRAIALASDLGGASYDRVMAAAYLAYNLQAQGRPGEARQVAAAALWLHSGHPVVYEIFVCRSVLADCHLDEGELSEAAAIFDELIALGESRSYRLPLAMAYFGLAYIRLTRGERAEGERLARRSLDLLAPSGAWELFVDQRERALVVCAAVAGESRHRHFVAKIERALAVRPGLVHIPASPPIRVETMGGLRAYRDGTLLPNRAWVSAKARELLALFITGRHEEMSLERAMSALWPDEPERSNTAFHTALYRLRGALRSPGDKTSFVLLENRCYRLDTTRFDLDVDRFERILERARAESGPAAEASYAEAIAIYRGEYLAGFAFPWLSLERQRLANAFLHALETLAALRAERGAIDEALSLTRRALAADPLLERAHQAAMRYLHLLGDRRGLERQYRELGELLADEMSAQPLPETIALYRRLSGDPP